MAGCLIVGTGGKFNYAAKACFQHLSGKFQPPFYSGYTDILFGGVPPRGEVVEIGGSEVITFLIKYGSLWNSYTPGAYRIEQFYALCSNFTIRPFFHIVFAV